jgi:hypothetical protein
MMARYYKSFVNSITTHTTTTATKRRCKDNIKMDLRGVGWERVDWSHVAWDRDQWCSYMKTVRRLRVPQTAENFLTSFSRRAPSCGVGWLTAFYI